MPVVLAVVDFEACVPSVDAVLLALPLCDQVVQRDCGPANHSAVDVTRPRAAVAVVEEVRCKRFLPTEVVPSSKVARDEAREVKEEHERHSSDNHELGQILRQHGDDGVVLTVSLSEPDYSDHVFNVAARIKSAVGAALRDKVEVERVHESLADFNRRRPFIDPVKPAPEYQLLSTNQRLRAMRSERRLKVDSVPLTCTVGAFDTPAGLWINEVAHEVVLVGRRNLARWR